MRLYHVTTPERAKMILKEGFNWNKNPNSHTPNCSDGHRLFLCREKDIPKWIRILSKEEGWLETTVLVIQIPLKWYKILMIRSWDSDKEPYIWDWGDQLVFDTIEPIKEGMFGIKINLR